MLDQVGLYLHIPFCRQKCGYCDFYSVEGAEDKTMDLFVKALSLHIADSAPALAKTAADTVYFGGGTPSLLGANRLTEILKTVRRHVKISDSAEITLEANPDSVDEKLCKKARKAGFNRLSLGVQSLDDGALETLGRVHTARQAKDAFDMARAAGFDNISADLIYGLPGQTMDGWRETLDDLCAWNPEHVSAYGLTLEEGTPMARRRLLLPSQDEQADMYLFMVDFLAKEGYEQYEISNFAKTGRASRHNQKYWRMDPYLGLGPGAHSDYNGRRWSFVRDVDAYIQGVMDGEDIVAEMEKVSAMDRAAEYIMLRLRTTQGFSGNEYARRYRANVRPFEKKMEEFAAQGLACRAGDAWRFTPKGFLLSNTLIAELLAVPQEMGGQP